MTKENANYRAALDILNGDLLSKKEQSDRFEAKTGFQCLDREIGNLYGGLHEGLIIIGAASSLNANAFCLQMADQMAGNGQDVIFISLDQSSKSMIAKSISRHIYKNNLHAKALDKQLIVKAPQEILNGIPENCSEIEKNAISQAIADYSKEAAHLFFNEGYYNGERLTVCDIRQMVQDHIERTGNRPVVFLDYLQILTTQQSFGTNKQHTDDTVLELKEIAKDFKIPVFAISSINRENYQEPISTVSFKESGAIEYSSDILLGLQYDGMDYVPRESDKDRKARLGDMRIDIIERKNADRPLDIELKCLKNQTGEEFTGTFQFTPVYNFFEEIPTWYKHSRAYLVKAPI